MITLASDKNNFMKIIFLATYFTALSGMVNAQNNDSIMFRKIAGNILSKGTAYDNLRMLTKQIGARLSGSLQQQKAEKATFQMMKDMGADTVYFQECMVPHWVRGEKEMAYYLSADGKKMPVSICALGNSIGTGKNGLKANIVEVRSWKELVEYGEKGIKGKIVFFNTPMDQQIISPADGYSEIREYRSEGPSRAAKYGAVATVVRSVASNTDDRPHTGQMTYNDSFPKIPAVAVSGIGADAMEAALRKNNSLSIFIRTTSETLPDVVGHNVIGEIRGSSFANEIITVGGHLDSWDLAEGAHDDGSGCVQSMELIRVFKTLGIRPKHTIRVVLFTDEENRSSGASKYFESAKAENKKHIFALESDDGGFVPRGFRFQGSEAQRQKAIQWLPLFLPYDVYKFEPGEAGADVEVLAPLGLPMAGLYPDAQRYFDLHHTSGDVFENVNKRELHLGAAVMAMLVYMVDEHGLN